METLRKHAEDVFETPGTILVLALGSAPNPHETNREQLTALIDVLVEIPKVPKVILAIDEQYANHKVLDTALTKLNKLAERYDESESYDVRTWSDELTGYTLLPPKGGEITIIPIASRIPSAYFQDLTEEQRIDKVAEFPTLKALADHCVPADTDPWTTFREIFALKQVSTIYVQNSAWWRLGSGRYSNLSMESMCELLHLLYASGKWKGVFLEPDPMYPTYEIHGVPALRLMPPETLRRPYPSPTRGRGRRTKRRVLKNPKTLKKRIR